MIHVCYGLRDESGTYSKYAGTSIQSLLENTQEPVTIHLMHDSTLSQENRNRFIRTVSKFNTEIFFYDVDKLSSDTIEQFRNLPKLQKVRHGIAMFYRMLIPDLLPREISRAIYLDSDTIVNLDIKDLWTIDLEDFPIAAFNEMYERNEEFVSNLFVCRSGIVAPEDYFNSGVLVMDLNRLRVTGGGAKISELCFKILNDYPETELLDQDALNVLFRENYRKLPLKFNYFVIRARHEKKTEISPAIYHYLSQSHFLDISDIFNQLWFEYFCRTPFCDAQTFGNIFKSIQKFTMDYTKIWHEILKISNINRSFPVDSLGFKENEDFFDAYSLIMCDTLISNSHEFIEKM